MSYIRCSYTEFLVNQPNQYIMRKLLFLASMCFLGHTSMYSQCTDVFPLEFSALLPSAVVECEDDEV